MNTTQIVTLVITLAVIGIVFALQIRSHIDAGPDQPGDDRVRQMLARALKESRGWHRNLRRIGK